MRRVMKWARNAALVAVAGSFAMPVAAQRPNQNPLVLSGARKAEFTATEATWMSVDVSPDGQTIVFDLLGDIWTMPITGGEATQITEGLPFDSQPRFSPDGETIVFVSDRSGGDNVWTMRMDQTDTTQVTRGNGNIYTSPDWMPDGEHIVVTRSGGLGGAAKLYMYNAEKPAPIGLVTTPGSLKITGPAPSPDGRYVWFSGHQDAFNPDWSYNATLPEYQLARFDRETGQILGMSGKYGSAFRPAISPDGQWLVYGTRHEAETGFRKRDLNTGREEWLAYPVQRDDQESRGSLDLMPGYSFTPDGSAIIASYGGKLWSIAMDGSGQTEIPFEADVSLDIAPEVKFEYEIEDGGMVTASQIRHPQPSPDGSMLVFEAFDRLWIRDGDGEPRRLTTQDEVGEFHATWSPDGNTIAYATWDDANGGHIMTIPVDVVTQPTQVTTDAALYYNLAFNPGGDRVVATRAAARQLTSAPDVFFGPQGGEFVWVPTSGGTATVISPIGTRDNLHFVMDEPDRLYAYSFVEGLVSFRWDGTDAKRHLMVRGAPARPTSMTLHPEKHTQLPGRVFPISADQYYGEQRLDPTGEQLEAGPPPPAGLVIMSPQGGRALAQVGSGIYTVAVPEHEGSTPPTVMVAAPAAAPIEVRLVSHEVGGEFPTWSGDGNSVMWALGNALFSYDLEHVENEETEAELEERGDRLLIVRAKVVNDSIKDTRAQIDSLEGDDEAEVPEDLRQRLRDLIADSVQVRADSLARAIAKMQRQADGITALADSVRSGLDSIGERPDTYRAAEERIDVQLARDMPEGVAVLRGGRAVTMNEHEIIENADIVITNSRITAIGPRGEVEIPEGAEIIDVSGKTLVPGFIDTHYHAQWLVPEIHSNQAWQYLTNLAYGVTTTRDPQTASTDLLTYGDRVETGGMLGPRIYSTGPGVFLSENIRSQEQADAVLERYAKYFDTKTLKMYMSGNRQQRQWIIAAAKKNNIMPTTEGGLDYKLNLTHALDGYPGIEHALPVAPIFQDVVELLKASGTVNSPTLLVSYGGPFGENYWYAKENVHDDPKLRRFAPHQSVDARSRRRGPGTGGSPGEAGWFLDEEHVFPRHAEFMAKLVENEVPVGVGSHGQLQGLGYHWELWSMQMGGMTPHDALRAATIFGAEAIGFGKHLGSLEAGKLADILVIDGDPLEDLRNTVNLDYVIMNGRVYEGETLNEVWPRQRDLPDYLWQDLGPSGVSAGVRN